MADGGDFVGSAAYILRYGRDLQIGVSSWNSSTFGCKCYCLSLYSSVNSSLSFLFYPYLTLSYCSPRGPLRWLDPGAFGTLGVGGGFALGAKLCFPDSEVCYFYISSIVLKWYLSSDLCIGWCACMHACIYIFVTVWWFVLWGVYYNVGWAFLSMEFKLRFFARFGLYMETALLAIALLSSTRLPVTRYVAPRHPIVSHSLTALFLKLSLLAL